MSIRERIIEQKKGTCSTCSETRLPALMVLVDHTRTGSWERYWQEVLELFNDNPTVVTIQCKNCAAVNVANKRKQRQTKPVSHKNFYVVRLDAAQTIPQWVQKQDFVVLVTQEDEYIEYPKNVPWKGTRYVLDSEPFSYLRVKE